VLSTYAGELLKRLPKTAAGGTAAQPPYSGTDWHVRLPDDEEGVLCSILATAEYCRWAGLCSGGSMLDAGSPLESCNGHSRHTPKPSRRSCSTSSSLNSEVLFARRACAGFVVQGDD
jgi:hypothetical protein